jgi:hypothetical protein
VRKKLEKLTVVMAAPERRRLIRGLHARLRALTIIKARRRGAVEIPLRGVKRGENGTSSALIDI